MTMLAEIEKSALPSTPAVGVIGKTGSSFADVLVRVLKRGGK